MYFKKFLLIFISGFLISSCASGPEISSEYVLPPNAHYLVQLQLSNSLVHEYHGITRLNDYKNRVELNLNIEEIIASALVSSLPKGDNRITFTKPNDVLEGFAGATTAYGVPDKISKSFHEYLRKNRSNLNGDVLFVIRSEKLPSFDLQDWPVVGVESNIIAGNNRLYVRFWVEIFDLNSSAMIAHNFQCGTRNSIVVQSFDDARMGKGVSYRLMDFDGGLYDEVNKAARAAIDSCIKQTVALLPS